MNRGNLFWEITFTVLYHDTASCADCENTNICVEGRDFVDVYEKAAALYHALGAGAKLYTLSIYLKDDGSVIPSRRYAIYQRNGVFAGNVDAFFKAGAKDCWRLAWRSYV